MPRKSKQDVKINNNESMEGLMQETYNDACLLINDAQRSINELINAAKPVDVDDLTKIAKERGNLLKLKDSGIKWKLEIAKLQNEIIKRNGNTEAALEEMSDGKASLDDFQSIREMFKNKKNDEE